MDAFNRMHRWSHEFSYEVDAWSLHLVDLGRNYFYFGKILSTLIEDAAYDIRVA